MRGNYMAKKKLVDSHRKHPYLMYFPLDLWDIITKRSKRKDVSARIVIIELIRKGLYNKGRGE